MIEHIHNSNLIENIDNSDEDAQSLEAWAYLISRQALSHHVIQRVQKIITLNQTDLQPDQRGYYRDQSQTNVHVGNHAVPKWPLVHPLMHNWLLDYPKLTPKESHIRFEHAHPFVDGNGRTGRMLMWWIEKQKGIEPTLIDFAKRDEYYKWFI